MNIGKSGKTVIEKVLECLRVVINQRLRPKIHIITVNLLPGLPEIFLLGFIQ